jgi:hypothetical protein
MGIDAGMLNVEYRMLNVEGNTNTNTNEELEIKNEEVNTTMNIEYRMLNVEGNTNTNEKLEMKNESKYNDEY